MITRRSALASGVAAAAMAGLATRGRAAAPADSGAPSSPPPVTMIRGQHVQLAHGGPVTPEALQIDPATGLQKNYVVLTPEERAKGFVRPVRRVYTHLRCETDTGMTADIAETFARDPGFYRTTFCLHERAHFPVAEFVWKGTQIPVGS